MDFLLPPVGEGLIEVELVRWLVNVGDHVRRGQGLMEVLSDKATMEVPAPFEGTIQTLSVTAGSKIKVGQTVLAYAPGNGAKAIAPGAVSPGATLSATVAASVATAPTRTAGSNGASPSTRLAETLPPAAPSVRLLARRLNIDLARVTGSGPNGRILLDDLTPFLNRPFAAVPPATTAPETPALDLGLAGTTVKLAGIRRKIAEHMSTAKRLIPHYSYIDECDFTNLVHLRDQLRESVQKQGVKLTYLAFVVKAVTRALKEVPLVNASFDEAKEEVTLHAHYHVGIAVAARLGLVVPVIHDADKKDVLSLAREIERLSQEAKAGKAKLDDLRGGTFTVTSVGNVGGLISTPIINHPQVGIMGLGKVVKRPVYDSHGNLRPAEMAYLSFSFDHRIVDGAIGATFGNAVVRQLQAPAALLVGDP